MFQLSSIFGRTMAGPELNVRREDVSTQTTRHMRSPQDNAVIREDEPISTSRHLAYSHSQTQTEQQPQPMSQPEPHREYPVVIESTPRSTRGTFVLHKPSRTAFLGYVYVLLASQIFAATLQWLFLNYRWRPLLTAAERIFFMMLLLLTWLNLSLVFFGFRRMQFTFPFNWIIFVCMFESLTLFVACLSIRELDLSWIFIVVAISMLLIYTPLGLWFPRNLMINIWILIVMSVTVLITAIFALITNLTMHIYLPITVCLIIFGPWGAYNAHALHSMACDPFSRFRYRDIAAKMYISFACTVAGLVLVSRIAKEAIELASCRVAIFCSKDH